MQNRSRATRPSPAVWLVSAVNVRFFRFNKPIALALAVGGLTLSLTVALALLLRATTCARWMTTVTLPYVEPGAECEPSFPNEGWIRSSLSRDSSGNFTSASRGFYTDNYTSLWSGWLEAMAAIAENASLTSHASLARCARRVALRCPEVLLSRTSAQQHQGCRG
jgi:hypothetical protein